MLFATTQRIYVGGRGIRVLGDACRKLIISPRSVGGLMSGSYQIGASGGIRLVWDERGQREGGACMPMRVVC